MKITDVQSFIEKLGNQLSDIKLIIPVLEGDVLTLKQKVQDAGFYCYIESSPFSPVQVVVTDASIRSS